jgi:hypothetical protein
MMAKKDDVPKAAEGLSRAEKKQVKESQRPRAAVVYEIVRAQGEAELIRPISSSRPNPGFGFRQPLLRYVKECSCNLRSYPESVQTAWSCDNCARMSAVVL